MAEEEETAAAPAGKGKLFIIIGVVVAVVIAVAVFFLMGSGDTKEEEVVSQPVATAEPVVYIALSQAFVFNVNSKTKNRIARIKAQLMLRGAKNEELARAHMPLIESTMLISLSVATVEQLRTVNGRGELRDKITEDVKVALNKAIGEPVIERVLFTDFVMQ
ncbi:flagellar basal body-associated FliL family protein [Vibrio caribbeanicus]|uniref:flagellar basal body-associated FliL family protein n=1 Tax=Vibrio caribbeanicus TaxID=701175 RepID=UPI0030D8E80F